MKRQRILLFNSTMMPQPGIYESIELDKEQWLKEIKGAVSAGAEPVSYIGYQQNADLLSKWLGFKVPVNNAKASLRDGEVIYVMKLSYRIADKKKKGKPVSEDDFEFWVVYYTDTRIYTEG